VTGLFAILLFAAIVATYFLPFIVACRHHKRNAAAIGMLNFFLGWTFLGWVIALIWAFKVDAVDVYRTHRADAVIHAEAEYDMVGRRIDGSGKSS